MTRTEYNNTVRELLGDNSAPAKDFAADVEDPFGFTNNAEVNTVSTLLVEQYMKAAEELAERAAANLGTILSCDPAVAGEDACAAEFVATFGQRAWRRPLTGEEKTRLLGIFTAGRAEGGFSEGVELVIATLLQSPNFLYRVEVGVPAEGEGKEGLLRPTDWEMASRLSYLLWASMPDAELFAAAEAGQLRTAEQVLAQARRMIVDPRARAMVADFHAQWYKLAEIDALDKDPDIYPDFSPAVAGLMRKEVEIFLDRAVWEEGDLKALFTATHTYLNKELADFYGISGPTGSSFVRVELDPTKASGLLTKPGLLAVLAKTNQSSPVHRGKFVREKLLCQLMPPPPPQIDIQPPALDPDLTTRERFSQHREDPLCAGCHVLMDPIGLGFEHYDGTGRWREDENGLVIDSSGELTETDINGAFDGVPELAHKLADSDMVRECMVKNWFKFAYGRAETLEDLPSLELLTTQFAAAGDDLRQLLLLLTQTDAFLYRRPVEGGSQ